MMTRDDLQGVWQSFSRSAGAVKDKKGFNGILLAVNHMADTLEYDLRANDITRDEFLVKCGF